MDTLILLVIAPAMVALFLCSMYALETKRPWYVIAAPIALVVLLAGVSMLLNT